VALMVGDRKLPMPAEVMSADEVMVAFGVLDGVFAAGHGGRWSHPGEARRRQGKWAGIGKWASKWDGMDRDRDA